MDGLSFKDIFINLGYRWWAYIVHHFSLPEHNLGLNIIVPESINVNQSGSL